MRRYTQNKSSSPPSTPPFSPEDQEIIARRLKEVNELISAFRALGYRNHPLSGQLFKPEPVKLQQTEIDAKLMLVGEGSYFFLDVGEDRSANELIKSLRGRWDVRRRCWSLPLSSLSDIRKCFKVREEKVEAESKGKGVDAQRESGKIVQKEVGDHYMISGDTKPHRDVWKALGGIWHPDLCCWAIKKENGKKLAAALSSLKAEGEVKEVKVVKEDESGSEEE
jgi:hypothetical protein